VSGTPGQPEEAAAADRGVENNGVEENAAEGGTRPGDDTEVSETFLARNNVDPFTAMGSFRGGALSFAVGYSSSTRKA